MNFTPQSSTRYARLKMWWLQCKAPLRLVIINTVIFATIWSAVTAMALLLPGPFGNNIPARLSPLYWLDLPGSWQGLALKPWTMVTYMFTQSEPLHLIFNMLWLYMFGRMLMTTCSGRQLTGLYLLGGISGALLFEMLGLLAPMTTTGGLEGSSAAIIAIVMATTVMMPHMRLQLMLIGEVKMLWIGIITMILLALNNIVSPAAQAAHIGGALAGLAFALAMRRGLDITAPINNLGDKIVNIVRGIPAIGQKRARRKATGTGGRRNAAGQPDRADISDILDKVKRSGYAALTPEERARLFGNRS